VNPWKVEYVCGDDAHVVEAERADTIDGTTVQAT